MREGLRTIGQQTKLVDDLLDLTRINQNKVRLKKENIDLNEILKNVALNARPQYRAKDIRLTVKVPKASVILSADPVRIAQCVSNLLQNALQYTPAAGRVTLSLENKNNDAVICVRDNGIGIDINLLPHLFEPFTQADTSLDRSNGGGLGLGLSIVKGIAELHGGSVAAFSEGDGKGSLFTIRLPLAARAAEAQSSESGEKTGRHFKILLIEDNKVLADILCDILSLKGHEVRSAYSGPEGITEAEKMRPDVIFCDIGLPGLSGFDVAKVLKADAALKSAFLISLTGYAGDSDLEQARIAGFDRHLAKPIDMAALEKILFEIDSRPHGQATYNSDFQ